MSKPPTRSATAVTSCSGGAPPPSACHSNEFSGAEYRIVNFVADLPLRLDRLVAKNERSAQLSHVVFALTEFQVADKQTALQNETGDSSHEAYKARQHERVKQRLFFHDGDPDAK
ncbi:MAG: hypothetical protein HC863_03100 [Myxococcales bacterium]|nr:hypothetical protein [Myxococcales bacterium]